MRILFFPKYDKDGPSSRYRTFQYLPYYYYKLEVDFDVFPFFDYGYVSTLKNKKSLSYYIFCICKRIKNILLFYKYDLIIIEKELIPYFPPIFEFLLMKFNKKFILDYDDAIYCVYKYHKNILVRFFYKNKIEKIASYSSLIITGSPELTLHMKKYNTNVIEIPTSIDLLKYKLNFERMSNNKKFVIGWIGSLSTSKHVELIKSAFNKIITFHSEIEIHLIGYQGNVYVESENFKIKKWSPDTELIDLNQIDVGVMPLIDSPFEHGKCGFKLIQYMACAKPTISTPFLANLKIDNKNGNLFASTDEEWLSCFKQMYMNREFFKSVGFKNRETVNQKYSIQSNGDKYIEIVKSLYSKK